MEHHDIRDKLSEYIDGSITGQERIEIEEHLKTCTTCNEAYQELRKTIEHIKTIEEIEPPAWMAKKIMANVRAAAKEKKVFFHRLFYPLAVKLPIQAVAVIFLAVTTFYIYRSIQPVSLPPGTPIQESGAVKEAPFAGIAEDKMKRTDESAPRSKKVPQAPAYKALDMKQEYEKPAPPVPVVPSPSEQPAGAPEPAKRESLMSAKDESAQGKIPAAPKAKAAAPLKAGNAEPEQRAAARMAAPAMVAEQASGTAPSAKGKEAEEILAVMEHFVRYDLPDAMKTKGLQYSARRVPEDLAGLQWLHDSTVYRTSTCSPKYLVDVELSGKSSKYLYCYAQDKPRLVAFYELKAGTWVETKK